MKAIATREAFGEALLRLAEVDSEFVVLDSDVSNSTNSWFFHQKYPDRAYNFGIAEQNMIGAAAGMAASGVPVFVTTYAVWISMRALEQVRTFICCPNLDVKLIASHGGLQVSSDGVTHQGTEDLAIMRSLPNMTVIQPADAVMTHKAVFAARAHKGPVYIRLTRNAVPVVYDEGARFEIGKGIVVRDSAECKCVIFATGLMVERSLRAAGLLEQEGINVSVVDIHTLKPLDTELIAALASRAGCVVTAEDHNILGSLGGAVAEVLVERAPVPMERIGLRDTYGESGDPEELFEAYGMGVEHIADAVRKAISRK